jgi:hypothetical protein
MYRWGEIIFLNRLMEKRNLERKTKNAPYVVPHRKWNDALPATLLDLSSPL